MTHPKDTAEAEAVMRPVGAPDLSANGILRMILRTATTELEDPRCDLLEAIKRGAHEVEAAIRRDREMRQEERDAALRAHIRSVERALQATPASGPNLIAPRWSTPALAWVVDTFGSDQGCDQCERAARFLEEAIEVGHVLGMSFGAVSALVTRTYLKPPVRSVANIRHELGQAEFTLALLVELFAATPPGYLGEREFHRVRALGEEFWRTRHAAKVAGIESVASMAGVVSASDTIAIRDAAIEECVLEIAVRPDPADLRSSLVAALRALKTKR